MKQFITILTAVIITATLHAQTKPGSITCTVTNAENKPVDAATIQLLKATDKALVKTAVSEKAGNFSFDKIAEGKYFISISAVGFAKKISTMVEVTATDTKITIPAIQLAAAVKVLSEVTIVST